MGFNWCHADGSWWWRAKPMDAPWPVEWQTGYTHEVLHLLGAGYHSNMLQCLNPGVDQRDVLSCANAEYTDYYDLLGSSNGWAPNLNARSRYHFGWLGADDVIAMRYRGTHAIAPLNSDPAAAGIFAQRAAVIPSLDLWLEWRTEAQAMDTGADGGGVFARNDGLFVRRHNTLIDADLQSCDPLTEEQWKGEDEWGESDGECGGDRAGHPPRRPHARAPHRGHAQAEHRHRRPRRRHPEAGARRPLHRRSAAVRCAAPRIATGLFGEWQFLDGSRDEWSYDATRFPDALPESYTRRTAHKANGVENNDAVGCGSDAAPITLALGATDVAPLPSGWSFAQPTSIAPGVTTQSASASGSPTTPPTATTTSAWSRVRAAACGRRSSSA